VLSRRVMGFFSQIFIAVLVLLSCHIAFILPSSVAVREPCDCALCPSSRLSLAGVQVDRIKLRYFRIFLRIPLAAVKELASKSSAAAELRRDAFNSGGDTNEDNANSIDADDDYLKLRVTVSLEC
jgi:hypothetical protein